MYHIVEVSSDTNIGGAGRCLLTLLTHFDRKKFHITVILPKKSLLKPQVEALGVPVYEVDAIAEKSLSWKAVSALKHLFRQLKPDLVHTHASMSARIAAKLAGAKIVYTRHSVFPPSKVLSTFPGKQINGLINHHLSDGIIAVAEAAKDNLTATGISAKKITVILNGVEPLVPVSLEEKKQLKKRFHVRPEENVVSIVARLEDIKGHDYFIDAADRVLKEIPNVKFLIAGTGSYESHLHQKVSDLHLEKNVLFTGFIKDVDKLMAITDIQANASYGTEATSLALLEGMSLGVPAVVSDFGGNPGVIKNEKNGLVIPMQNAEALANGILRLLTDAELYDKTSQGAKKIFSEQFTAEAMTKHTEHLYSTILGGTKQ